MSMPTVAQVNRALGKNVHTTIRSAHAEQRAADDAARRQREAQPSGNETVSGSIVCPLAGTGAGTPVSTRVTFARMGFLEKPAFLCGSRMVGGASEAVFGLARVDSGTWETDAAGLYRGVSIVAGYIGTPVLATSITIDYLFIGPALRLA